MQVKKDAIEKIADKFGIESRKNQLVEEMSELTQVICKINRVKANELALAPGLDQKSLEESLIEEIADVNIVLQQLIYLVGENRVERVMEEKIDRTISRMAQKNIKKYQFFY